MASSSTSACACGLRARPTAMARPRSIASGHRPQRHKPQLGLQTAQPRAAHLGDAPSGGGASERRGL
eukprot:4931844-Alexandrium_andersonii.AAC.1